VAFDLDGILIDTEPIFAEAVKRFLDRRGLRFEPVVMHRMMGTPAAQSLPIFRDHYELTETIESIGQECKAHFFDALGDEPGPLMPGVGELLHQLRARAIPFCIATSSKPEFVRAVFGPHGFLDYFHFVLTCDDVRRGKPHPDVYELAADRFAIDPAEMLVFEDSPNGVRAAKTAGARCIAVPHAHTPRPLIADADHVVPGLHSEELQVLLGWETGR
jgi:HAD superfamily hydrolase (TIGR01509 family)